MLRLLRAGAGTTAISSTSSPSPISLRRLLSLEHSTTTTTTTTTTAALSSELEPKPKPKRVLPPVAVFWDLDNKPPNYVPPYDAAVRLKFATSRFGPVELAVAYANGHAFRHVPAPALAQRQERRTLDRLEDAGTIAPRGAPPLPRVRPPLLPAFQARQPLQAAPRAGAGQAGRSGRVDQGRAAGQAGGGAGGTWNLRSPAI